MSSDKKIINDIDVLNPQLVPNDQTVSPLSSIPHSPSKKPKIPTSILYGNFATIGMSVSAVKIKEEILTELYGKMYDRLYNELYEKLYKELSSEFFNRNDWVRIIESPENSKKNQKESDSPVS